MVPYTTTHTYLTLIADVEHRIELAQLTRQQLGRIKKPDRTSEQQRQFHNLSSQINWLSKQLKQVQELDVSDWDLLRMLMAVDGTVWSGGEIEMWYDRREANEGAGDKALNIRHGLSPKSTYKTGDLIKYNAQGERVLFEENKKIEASGGVSRLQDIQTGKAGRNAYCDWHGWQADNGLLLTLNADQRIAVQRGELTSKTLRELPKDVRDSLMKALLPSKVISDYDAINATSRHGFLRVPKADCDRAWVLHRVSRCVPNYLLRRDYLRLRLKASVVEQQPDVVTQQAFVPRPRLGLGLGLL